jgi:RNA polymerase sigma-70 factor, ECF subfamily
MTVKLHIKQNEVLEAAQQAAIKYLFQHYRQLPPNAIKIFLACVESAELIEVAGVASLSPRPSIRRLASACNVSKTTVQSALEDLVSHGLLQENRPVLELNNITPFFHYRFAEGKAHLLAINTDNQPATLLVPSVPPGQKSLQEKPRATSNRGGKQRPGGLPQSKAQPLPDQVSAESALPPTAVISIPAPTEMPSPPAAAPKVETPLLLLAKQSDADLIRLYHQGNQNAFGELYNRYFDSVRIQISHQLPEAVSYDVTQQIFIELMKKLHEYQVDGEAKFSTWLYKFTAYAIANARRKSSRETQIAEDYDIQTIIRLTNPQQQIMPYLLSLDEKQQECVLLHYYEGFSYKEISQRLGLDEATVRTHLQTARRHIRQFIEKHQYWQNELGKQRDWLYNTFFISTLEKEILKAAENGKSFTLSLFSTKLRKEDASSEQLCQIDSMLGSIIMNNIRITIDSAFLLDTGHYALILPECSAAAAQSIAHRIRTALASSASIPIMLAAAILEYKSEISLDMLLQMLSLKLMEAVSEGDATMLVDSC